MLQAWPITDASDLVPTIAPCAAAKATQMPFDHDAKPVVAQDIQACKTSIIARKTPNTIHCVTGQQQVLGEDAHIQQAAASLSRFVAQWPEPADTNQLMHGLTLVPPLLKILDSKKHACASKQSAMELLGQLALFSDAYRTDIITQGGVAALVRQLRCEQPACAKGALLAMHRLVVLSKQRTAPLGEPDDEEVRCSQLAAVDVVGGRHAS